MAKSGKIALVTLTHSPHSDPLESTDLEEEIRRNLASSKLSEHWTIEKITVLDEVPPRAGPVRDHRESLLVP